MANKLVAIGEALIDLIPSRKGCSFGEVESFSPKTGGAPANVCAVYSKLGGEAVMLTQLGDDPFGHKIKDELSHAGIDTTYIAMTDAANTALAFVSLDKDGDRTFSFYRNPSADMLYAPDQVPQSVFDGAYALHFCSVSLGDFPMKEAHRRAIEYASGSGALISFDPNLRFMLWDDKKALKRAVLEFIPYADIIKVSDEELEFITGFTDIKEALPWFWDQEVRLVLYTCGKDGMRAYTANAEAASKASEVRAVDTTGAGDASIGSFLWKLCRLGVSKDNIGIVDGALLGEAVRFAAEYCSMSVQHEGAIPSYPTLEEMKNR